MQNETNSLDIYTDLFITHGGLVSKKITQNRLATVNYNKVHDKWKLIKRFVLDCVNTHNEVKERQVVLQKLFTILKLGQSIKPLQKEGDLLLRDFIVEVKQPSVLKLSRTESSSVEGNDSQLLRAMRYRKQHWGILTNGAEWQFVFVEDLNDPPLVLPFLSFSLLDMIKDEEVAKSQIALFISMLTNRQFRGAFISDSKKESSLAVRSFADGLKSIVSKSIELGYKQKKINELIEYIFKLTFLFYAEDLGALPRHSKNYRKYDIRARFRSKGKIELTHVSQALKLFSEQHWSINKINESGNSEFWSEELERWMSGKQRIFTQLNIHLLWFDKNGKELDISDISSSDLCDVYQSCVHYEDESVGTVYTNRNLSNLVNHWVSDRFGQELEEGDIILDPACGSGHLLKRMLYLVQKFL